MKRKLLKRVLSMVLVLAMCVGIFPLTSFAMEPEKKAAGPYYQDFSAADAKIDNWKVGGGVGDAAIEDGTLSLRQNNPGVSSHVSFYDEASPVLENGYVETVMVPQQHNRIGIAFRYQSHDKFAAILYDEWNGWQWGMSGSSWGNLNVKTPAANNGEEVKVRIEYEGAHIRLILNDKTAYEGDIPQLDIGAGRIGARMWGEGDGAGHAHFKYFKNGEIIHSGVTSKEVKIASEEWGTKDVQLELTLGEEDSLKEIKNGETVLKENTDYTVNDNTVTLKKEYLAANPEVNSLWLKFVFTLGSEVGVSVIKVKPFVAQEYVNNFDSLDGIVKKSGNGSYELTEDGLHVKGEVLLVDENAPKFRNGEIEITFQPAKDNENGGLGVVFRAEGNKWAALQNTNNRTNWFLARYDMKNSAGRSSAAFSDTVIVYSEREHKLKVRFVDDTYTVWIDGLEASHFASDIPEQNEGLPGIMSLGKGSTEMTIRQLVYRNTQPLDAALTAETETVSLTSEKMMVTMDAAFPRVIEYNYGGSVMYGQIEPKYYAMVNGVNYPATAKVTAIDEKSITYRVTVEEAKVNFDVTYTVEGSNLTMDVSNIDETNTRVYTLGFPENSMISVKENQPGARIDAASNMIKADGSSGDNIKDFRSDLSKHLGYSNYRYANIPILSTNEISASMINTVYNNAREFKFKSFTAADGIAYTGVWNNEFVNRAWGFGLDSELDPEDDPADELSCTVALGKDENKDGQVDWQDGALALNHVRDMIPGAEQLQDSQVLMAMNFASGVQHPFLRLADDVKKFYMYTDGFDQMLQIKGFNNEGHDSAHSSASDINMRAGGAKDFQELCEIVEPYNVKIGVHTNVSNMFPESRSFKPQYAGLDNAHSWEGWLDRGHDIKRETFISEGAMDAEYNGLKEQIPGLDFVFVDTINEFRYGYQRITNRLLKNGWPISSENGCAFDKFNTWLQWGGDGIGSEIHRFVHHQEKDTYHYDNRFGGTTRQDGFLSWHQNQDINNTIRNLFSEELSYRYLMNHELLKLSSNEAIFADNVRSTSGKEIYKDGKLIARGGLVFIPWFATDSETKNPDEAAKIYHWNPNGGETTWNLPDSWANQTEIKLYRLTDTGKTDEQIISVKDGSVTINAAANTPYVVYKGNETLAEVKVERWSEAHPVKDASFISHGFDYWTPTGDVKFAHTNFNKCYLEIGGNTDGSVSQEITLVPGQKYELSVYAEVNGGKQAVLEVELPDGTVVSNYMDESPLSMNDINNSMRRTKFLRMPVFFTMPQGTETTATLTLKGIGEKGTARFVDVRAVETTRPDLEPGYILNEDFEHVTEGYGSFFSTHENERTHLSQKGVEGRGEYVDRYNRENVIGGEFSLKCKGNSVRTVPFTVRFAPNTEYFFEFDSIGGGTVSVRNESGSETLLSQSVHTGKNEFTFTTGEAKDYFIRFDGPGVLDNMKVYSIVDLTPPTAPANLTAVLENDKEVTLTWEAASDTDTGVSVYIIYRNGEELDTVKGDVTTYVDTDTVDQTTYTYEVSAFNKGGTESPKSNPVEITTGISYVDIDYAVIGSLNEAQIYFNKVMDKATAENVENYQITGASVTAKSAVLSPDGKSVTLTLDGMVTSDSIMVTVNNVKDATQKYTLNEASVVLSGITKYDFRDLDNLPKTWSVYNGLENGVSYNEMGAVIHPTFKENPTEMENQLLFGAGLSGDWTVESHISLSRPLSAENEKIGFYLVKDTNNWVMAAQEQSSNEETMQICWSKDGIISNGGTNQECSDQTDVYFRMKKTGTTFDLYYSTDGKDFTLVDTEVTDSLFDEKIALQIFASGQQSDNPSFDATVEYCTITLGNEIDTNDYQVTVNGGTADKTTAKPGEIVTVKAEVPDDKEFVNWTSDTVAVADANAAETTFVMPARDVVLTANFEKKGPKPVHWYQFDDDGAPLKDTGTNPIEGIKFGTLNYDEGFGTSGKCLSLSGYGNVNVPDATFKDNASYSIAAWIKWNGAENSTIVGSHNNDVWFRVHKGRLIMGNWPGGFELSSGENKVPKNEWVHVAIVSDAANGTTLYINGNNEGTSPKVAGWYNEGTSINIGGRTDWQGHTFGGMLDDVRLYNVALTAEQIASIASDGTDESSAPVLPDGSVTEGTAEAAGDEAASDETASDETASDETASDETASDEAASEDVTVTDAASVETTFVMPEKDVTVTVNFEDDTPEPAAQ